MAVKRCEVKINIGMRQYSILPSLEAFEINCQFQSFILGSYGSIYQCISTNIPTLSEMMVTNITGTHYNDNTNVDVEALAIYGNYTLTFFPRGVSNFFINIKMIEVKNTAIDALFGDEFDEFPKLQFLEFYQTNLTTISSTLFDKTPKMISIRFKYNMIEKVGYDLFTPINITQIKEINFEYNKCINAYSGNALSVLGMFYEIREKCPYNDEFSTIKPKYFLISIGDVYRCRASEFSTTSGVTVTNITGEHLGSRNNIHVHGIYINNDRTLTFVPRNFSKFFPNIKAITFYFTAIERLFGDEFDEYPELLWLQFFGTRLTTISSKVFDKTPKIVFISFNVNMIEKVGHDLFKPLNITQLQTVSFNGNPCIHEAGSDNQTAIILVIKELQKRCRFDDENLLTTVISSSSTIKSTTTTKPQRKFNCNYGYWDIVQINTLYQCETTNISTTSGEFVTNVTGTHLNGKNYNNIEAIKIDGKYSLSFVPRGLSNFFPKIRVIYIFFASIGTLFGDEFDEFPNLEYLALTSCGITTISSKLFENTPKIAYVTFNNNQLKRIGYDLFTPLNVRQLREVNFAYVGCISRSVYTENVISLINDLRQKCPYDDEFPPTTTTIKNILCPNKNIEEFVCDLKNLMIELQDDLTAKNERINKIESELFQIKEEVKQLRREMFNQE